MKGVRSEPLRIERQERQDNSHSRGVDRDDDERRDQRKGFRLTWNG